MVCMLCEALKDEYRLIFKDDYAFSIVNIEPLKKFHLMVLPIRHVESLNELTMEESKSIMDILYRLEKAIINLSEESPLIIVHRGNHPSQPHIHFHILPSKTNFRNLISKFENVPPRKSVDKILLSGMRDEIINFF